MGAVSLLHAGPGWASSFISLSSYCHQFVSSTLSSSASAFCCVHFYCFDVERVLGIPPNRRLVHGLAGARCMAGMMKLNENLIWTKTALFCLISAGRKLMWVGIQCGLHDFIVLALN